MPDHVEPTDQDKEIQMMLEKVWKAKEESDFKAGELKKLFRSLSAIQLEKHDEAVLDDRFPAEQKKMKMVPYYILPQDIDGLPMQQERRDFMFGRFKPKYQELMGETS